MTMRTTVRLYRLCCRSSPSSHRHHSEATTTHAAIRSHLVGANTCRQGRIYRTARLLRQLKRFFHPINPDKGFGTHSQYYTREARCWRSTTSLLSAVPMKSWWLIGGLSSRRRVNAGVSNDLCVLGDVRGYDVGKLLRRVAGRKISELGKTLPDLRRS